MISYSLFTTLLPQMSLSSRALMPQVSLRGLGPDSGLCPMKRQMFSRCTQEIIPRQGAWYLMPLMGDLTCMKCHFQSLAVDSLHQNAHFWCFFLSCSNFKTVTELHCKLLGLAFDGMWARLPALLIHCFLRKFSIASVHV